jgi:hypothetical protein
MVTLYGRDARAVSTLLALVVKYHETVSDQDLTTGGNSSQLSLTEIGGWGLRPVDGGKPELAALGIGTRLMIEVGTPAGKHRAVADYLSSVCNEIDTQLKKKSA